MGPRQCRGWLQETGFTSGTFPTDVLTHSPLRDGDSGCHKTHTGKTPKLAEHVRPKIPVPGTKTDDKNIKKAFVIWLDCTK